MILFRPALILMVVSTLGCGGNDWPDLLEVPPPPHLETLDPPVREQYVVRRAKVDGLLEDSQVDQAVLGDAFGDLGTWHHVYRYKDNAIAAYRNATRYAPANPRWWYYLALQLEEIGQMEEVRTCLRTICDGGTAYPAAVDVRLGEMEIAAGNTDAAHALFEQALIKAPESARALLGRAKIALLNGEAEAAIVHLETAQEQQPNGREIQYLLARAYQDLGSDERAQTILEEMRSQDDELIAVKLRDPWLLEVMTIDRGARAMTKKAQAAFQGGRHREAAEYFGRSLAINPDNLEARVNYGECLRLGGQLKAAEEQFHHVLEVEPHHVRAHLHLGHLMVEQQRLSQAEEQFDLVLAEGPSTEAHLSLAELLVKTGRWAEATGHFVTVRSMGRLSAHGRFWHAVLLLRQDLHAEALALLERDVVEEADDVKLRLLLARVLATSPVAELRDGRRALALVGIGDDEQVSVVGAETIAMVLAEQGRFDEAQAWQGALVAACEEGQLSVVGPRARRRLMLYSEHKPCRNPWEVDERLVEILVDVPD